MGTACSPEMRGVPSGIQAVPRLRGRSIESAGLKVRSAAAPRDRMWTVARRTSAQRREAAGVVEGDPALREDVAQPRPLVTLTRPVTDRALNPGGTVGVCPTPIGRGSHPHTCESPLRSERSRAPGRDDRLSPAARELDPPVDPPRCRSELRVEYPLEHLERRCGFERPDEPPPRPPPQRRDWESPFENGELPGVGDAPPGDLEQITSQLRRKLVEEERHHDRVVATRRAKRQGVGEQEICFRCAAVCSRKHPR